MNKGLGIGVFRGVDQSNYHKVDSSAFQSFLQGRAVSVNTPSDSSNSETSFFSSTMFSSISNWINSSVEVQKEETQEGELFRKQFNLECQKMRESSNLSDRDNLYSFYPSLGDIKKPLRDGLELEFTVSSIFGSSNVKTLKPSHSGLSGRVKFVRFANDPIKDRWFAIKRPNSFNDLSARLFGQVSKDNQAAMDKYQNNLMIALKIGPHPNFMQVHGVIVKEKKQGESSKPYLIMEYVPGEDLNNLKKLSQSEVLDLASQLKDAFIRLYECQIVPVDANNGNLIITPDNVIKMIDFDAWTHLPEATPQDVGQSLYSLYCRIVMTLQEKTGISMNLNSPMQNQFMQDKEGFVKELKAVLGRLHSFQDGGDLYGLNKSSFNYPAFEQSFSANSQFVMSRRDV